MSETLARGADIRYIVADVNIAFLSPGGMQLTPVMSFSTTPYPKTYSYEYFRDDSAV